MNVLPHTTTKPAVLIANALYRRAAYGTNHPLAIPRIGTVIDLCQQLGWTDNTLDSPRASDSDLAMYHDADYIDAVRRADERGKSDRSLRDDFGLGTLENPVFTGMYARTATACGGSILAAQCALDGKVAFSPAGGMHHAQPGRASGFCYFNDPVLAILTLKAGGARRVFYADLDAHHGDGVENAFADDPDVLTLSIHEENRWPYSGKTDQPTRAIRNFPVPKGFNDCELDLLMDCVVMPAMARFAPDAAVITCGADGLDGDPLSGMALSNGALWRAVRRITAQAPGTAVLGGGGYNPWTLARCWAGLWGVLNGFSLPDTLPAASQTLLRGLECDLIDEEDAPETWFTRLADAPKTDPVRPAVLKIVEAATQC
jgi:acetoin utilization protein AcuC